MRMLVRQAEILIDHSIADSTRRNDVSGVRNCILFCEQLDLIPFPLYQNNVILFVTDLSTSVSVSSINVQLSAIKSLRPLLEGMLKKILAYFSNLLDIIQIFFNIPASNGRKDGSKNHNQDNNIKYSTQEQIIGFHPTTEVTPCS